MKIVDGVMRMVPFTATERAAILAGTWTPGGPVVPTIKPGELVETVTRCDETGRKIRTFHGDKAVWMRQFESPRMLQIRINKDAKPMFSLGGVTKGGDIV
jgi:hypothetical protein